MDKKYSLVFSIVLFCSILIIVIVSALVLSTFKSGESSVNTTFLPSTNYSINITLDKTATVNSAYLNLTGYNVSNGTGLFTLASSPLAAGILIYANTSPGALFDIIDLDSSRVEGYYWGNKSYAGATWSYSPASTPRGGNVHNCSGYEIIMMTSDGDNTVREFYAGNKSALTAYLNTSGVSPSNTDPMGVDTDCTYYYVSNWQGSDIQRFYYGNKSYADKFETDSYNTAPGGIEIQGEYMFVIYFTTPTISKVWKNNNTLINKIAMTNFGCANTRGLAGNETFLYTPSYSSATSVCRVYTSAGMPLYPNATIGSTSIWSWGGTFLGTNTTNDFSATLNSAISGGTCSGGYLEGNNCTITLKIHSDLAEGIINISDLNIDYTVGGGADTTAPKWQTNSTNSTIAGYLTQHKINWTDDTALSGYIFSFDNGTGSFTNDSWVSFTGTQNWTNVTKVINSTVGSAIRWIVYANDSSNNLNATSTFSYLTTSPNVNTTIVVVNSLTLNNNVDDLDRYNKQLHNSLTLTGQSSRFGRSINYLFDSLTLNNILKNKNLFGRLSLQSLNINQNAGAKEGLLRKFFDFLTISNNASRTYNGNRLTSDSITINSQSSYRFFGIKQAIQQISFFDSSNKAFFGFRISNQNLLIVNSVYKTSYNFRLFVDSISISNQVSELFFDVGNIFIRVVTQSFSFLSNTSHKILQVRSIHQNFGINAAIERTGNMYRTLTEIIDYFLTLFSPSPPTIPESPNGGSSGGTVQEGKGTIGKFMEEMKPYLLLSILMIIIFTFILVFAYYTYTRKFKGDSRNARLYKIILSFIIIAVMIIIALLIYYFYKNI